MLVPAFFKVTLAPTTTAPEASLIVPVTPAVACCAIASVASVASVANIGAMHKNTAPVSTCPDLPVWDRIGEVPFLRCFSEVQKSCATASALSTCSLFQSKDEPGEEPGRWWRKLLSGLDSEPI